MMRVQIRLAETRKMLERPQNSRRAQAGKELPRVADDFSWPGGDGSRIHDLAGRLEREIDDRSKIRVKSEGATGLSENLSVFTIQPGVAAAKNIGGGGCPAEDIAKTIDPASLEVHAGEKRRGNAGLAIFEQAKGLLSPDNVALRANRITPAGWTRVSRERSFSDISVPSNPMIRSWPIGCRRSRPRITIGKGQK